VIGFFNAYQGKSLPRNCLRDIAEQFSMTYKAYCQNQVSDFYFVTRWAFSLMIDESGAGSRMIRLQPSNWKWTSASSKRLEGQRKACLSPAGSRPVKFRFDETGMTAPVSKGVARNCGINAPIRHRPFNPLPLHRARTFTMLSEKRPSAITV
jgi:hypothetical protein